MTAEDAKDARKAARKSKTRKAAPEVSGAVWLRPSQIEERYSIRKGTLYNLFKAGLPSFSICGKGGRRGSRLVKVSDLEAFLEEKKMVEKVNG